LVISSDEFNTRLGTHTILGLTTLGGRAGTSKESRDIRKWSTLLTIDDYPQISKGNADIKATRIDCNRLWTTSMPVGSQYDYTLNDKHLEIVNRTLFRLLDGQDSKKPKSPIFDDGTIIEMTFSEPGSVPAREWFLVASSPAWDWQRQWTTGTCSVVRILSATHYDELDPLQTQLHVRDVKTGKRIEAVAQCNQIYTLQWKHPNTRKAGIERGMKRVGKIPEQEEQIVAEKILSLYLNLL